jgi:hypothetical protein
MTKLCVLITGPMRSGTAAVSQVVHYLGFNAGVAIHAPAPPAWRSDWEDFELANALIQLCPMGDSDPTSSQRTAALNFFANYVRRRMDWLSALQEFSGVELPGWSMKSPLLALFMDEARAAIGDEPDLRLRTIEVVRDTDGMAASWNRTLSRIEGAADTQWGIMRAVAKEQFTLRVDYDELVAHPDRGVLAIAGALDVNDEAAIGRAKSVVKRPTSKEAALWCGSRV